jgi:hypothetical protein
VRSYRTISPLPASTLAGLPRRSAAKAGGIISVALSLGLRPAAVSRHRVSVESGLSSGLAARNHPAIWPLQYRVESGWWLGTYCYQSAHG